VTPSVTAPGDNNPSDSTESHAYWWTYVGHCQLKFWRQDRVYAKSGELLAMHQTRVSPCESHSIRHAKWHV